MSHCHTVLKAAFDFNVFSTMTISINLICLSVLVQSPLRVKESLRHAQIGRPKGSNFNFAFIRASFSPTLP